MQRFTISLEDSLAEAFDQLIAAKGYSNRSEAVRDLIRQQLGHAHLQAQSSTWCVANLSYVYDHHDLTVTSRVMDLQHQQHDVVISTLHTHLDHDHCLESVVLRGPTAVVQALSEQLMALRGVRHGSLNLVPLGLTDTSHQHADKVAHSHAGGHVHSPKDPAPAAPHKHFKPLI
ncbi:MAG: nickel-responsive transcriptional regulator NikR [Burkholderiaceae bacterium]